MSTRARHPSGDFGGKPAMLLGADLLSRYRLLYEHEARKIWIRPSIWKVLQ